MQSAVRGPKRWLLPATLTATVIVILLATASAIFALWPQPGQVAHQEGIDGSTGAIVSARIVSIVEEPCSTADPAYADPGEFADAHTETGSESASEPDPGIGSTAEEMCLSVRAALPIGKQVEFTLYGLQAETQPIQEGDRVNLLEQPPELNPDGEISYVFYDFPRGSKMIVLALIFVLIVVAVGRWRGALALVGVAAAILLLILFILPAILAGKPPLPVSITGSIGIMLVVLYLAHGISRRTTAALFGSIFGILFTAFAGFAVTRWLKFSGIASTEDGSLLFAVPGLQMNDVLTATIVIAGLGILNDITVAQASAVWEMRELNPGLLKRRIYLSAMRVGRDHIASSIYTLVFAYAGAMFVVLLLLYNYPRDLIDLVTSEQIAQEIIRTLVGAAGLVLSMPVTTLFAVLFTEHPTTVASEKGELSAH